MPVELKNLHSFQLPANGNSVLYIERPEQLQSLQEDEQFLILAAGSNTVFVDDYAGTIVIPSFYGISVDEQTDGVRLRVGASENWHQIVTYCVDNKLNGFENLALIPGTVGAAPVQNIGAYGVEIEQFIESVEVVTVATGEVKTLTKAACHFSYRDSLFKRQPGRFLITAVNFYLPKRWQPRLDYGPLQRLASVDQLSAKTIYDEVIRIRQSKLPDPVTTPNAGSFFKNPLISDSQLEGLQQRYPNIVFFRTDKGAKIAAGWLIDKLGLKGFQQGGAAVHSKQALVLVNRGNATGDDVITLCRYIRQQVAAAFDIWLEVEVRLIGPQGLIVLDGMDSVKSG